jgi:hypothetical protein
MSTDLAASDALVNLLRPDTGKAFAPDDLQAYFPLAKADELSLPGTPAAQLPVFLDRTLEAGSQARMSLSVAVAIDITERPGNFERVFLWQPGGHGNRISGGTENAFGQPKARPSTPVTASLGLPMLLIFWCCFRRIATAARV